MIGLSGIFTRKENSTNPDCMMSDNHLLARYNYDEFVPEKFSPWMNFSNSPPLGYPAPDFPCVAARWRGYDPQRNLVKEHIHNHRIRQLHLTLLRDGGAIHEYYC